MSLVCIPQKAYDLLKDRALKGEVSAEEIAAMLPVEKAAMKAILQEFVAEKLGVSVSNGEVEEIQKKAIKIDAAQKAVGDDLGNPSKPKENLDFFIAKKEMNDYLANAMPSNSLKVLTGTVGRGAMLASVKSPLLNIGSNIEVGATEFLARRIAAGKVTGASNELVIDYMKMARDIYKKTGYDISRMQNVDDTGLGGERVLGQSVHAQGPGKIRAIGRVAEDIVFKNLMGAPDAAFASAHFADSVNLNAMKMAEGDRGKAIEMMNDAMRLTPQTPEGEALKAQGVLDAQVATWTDKTWASRVSEGIRKVLNDVSGDLRAGDYLLPFVKTPANVIATGMDYAGLGIPKGAFEAVKAFRSGELGNKERMQAILKPLVRAGLGLTMATVIASQLNDDDFVGAYDPSRAQIETLRNSNYNAIRVGGKWISVDWLGPLAVSVSAMMYARKYGKAGPEEAAFQYGKGVGSQVMNLPGVSDLFGFYKSQQYNQNKSLQEMTGEAGNYITEQIYSRLVPSIVSDIAKASDTYERVGGKGLAGIEAKIPGVRQLLPIKANIFGEKVKDEGALTNILFGSRVRTDKETPLISEIKRVSDAVDKGVNFTDWGKSSSKKLDQFRSTVGNEKFNEAKVKYGQYLKAELDKTIKSSEYKKASDDDKLALINKGDSDAQDKVFKEYGFKYKTVKKAP